MIPNRIDCMFNGLSVANLFGFKRKSNGETRNTQRSFYLVGDEKIKCLKMLVTSAKCDPSLSVSAKGTFNENETKKMMEFMDKAIEVDTNLIVSIHVYSNHMTDDRRHVEISIVESPSQEPALRGILNIKGNAMKLTTILNPTVRYSENIFAGKISWNGTWHTDDDFYDIVMFTN